MEGNYSKDSTGRLNNFHNKMPSKHPDAANKSPAEANPR